MRHAILYGEHELSIDEKNRLLVPSEVRRSLETERDGDGFFLVIGTNLRPWLYPERYYEELISRVPGDVVPDEDVLAFDQMHFAMASRVAPDKQGRVLVPEKVLARTGTRKEVTLIGARDHLEIWNRADWEKQFAMLLEKKREVERALRTKQVERTRQDATRD